MQTVLLALSVFAYVLVIVLAGFISNLLNRVAVLEHQVESTLKQTKSLADFAVTTGEAVVQLQKVAR